MTRIRITCEDCFRRIPALLVDALGERLFASCVRGTSTVEWHPFELRLVGASVVRPTRTHKLTGAAADMVVASLPG